MLLLVLDNAVGGLLADAPNLKEPGSHRASLKVGRPVCLRVGEGGAQDGDVAIVPGVLCVPHDSKPLVLLGLVVGDLVERRGVEGNRVMHLQVHAPVRQHSVRNTVRHVERIRTGGHHVLPDLVCLNLPHVDLRSALHELASHGVEGTLTSLAGDDLPDLGGVNPGELTDTPTDR